MQAQTILEWLIIVGSYILALSLIITGGIASLIVIWGLFIRFIYDVFGKE